jgi:prepilin-type N-terminal cleavage/methylation domain-containing protein/prepilin-type processing-associated H-X9-DG protein
MRAILPRQSAGTTPSQSSTRGRAGFTLVEMLVVIAIIAVLASLLLPAVQNAREAARRTECVNNLKQMGLGLMEYHNAYKAFPIGAVFSYRDDGSSQAQVKIPIQGGSFFVSLLPWMDQQNVFDRLAAGATGGIMGLDAPGNLNRKVLDGVFVKNYFCPSSVGAKFTELSTNDGPLQFMNPTYAGISGAAFQAGAISPRTESIGSCGQKNWCCTSPDSNNCGALLSNGGILLTNESATMTSVVDGTSNTIAIGEQSSAYSSQLNPTTGAIDVVLNEELFRSCYGAGGWAGTSLPRKIDTSSPPDSTHFVFNVTTVRYRINANGVTGEGALEGAGFGEGNKPLSGAHPGVANVLLADGSTRGLAAMTDINVLMMLCDRADRGIIRNGDF